ncbi:DUF4097 family beta strand repeat-containing protein [Nonomuraea sp. NPDC049714]|uniref:DUF4097 family beta strand repeat-containing protein n=1 Tax=Nonomuraea sp. NPDC049714 TaxID=3364357 RepID=UPI0037BD4B0A
MSIRRSGVVAGSLALAALLTGCGLAGPVNSDTASYDVADKVTAIEVETDSGQIEVIESDRAGIHVTEHLTWQKRKPTTTHETQGGTLVLTFTCPGGWMAGNCDVGYQVEIPRGLRVKTVSDSGKVTLRDLSGDVEAATDSGAIEADGLTGKQVVSKSDSGAVTLAFAARPGKVETSTDSGAITLAFAAPPDKVVTSTDSGKTVVRVPEGPYNVVSTTDSGNEHLNTVHDPSAPRSLTLTSDSGDIDILPS